MSAKSAKSPQSSQSSQSPTKPSRSTRRNHKKVYTIGGHGDNGTDRRFIVPKGCTIVVREHTGNIAHRYTEDINKLCGFDTNTLTDPMKNSVALNAAYGSVAIYPAGSKCPNFNYYTLGCYRHKDRPWDGCPKFRSGVIDVRKAKHFNECLSERGEFNPNQLNLEEYLAENYKYSEWPTSAEASAIISNLRSLFNHETDNEFMNKLLSLFTITQKDLCNLLPGVYYNFVCRTFNKSESLIREAKITEAEMHRKPHLKAYYANERHKANAIDKQEIEIERLNKILRKIHQHMRDVRIEYNLDWNNNHPALNENKADYQEVEQNRQKAVKALRNLENNNNNMRKHLAYYAPNGNYIKINGKWVPRTKKTQKMKHKSPKH